MKEPLNPVIPPDLSAKLKAYCNADAAAEEKFKRKVAKKTGAALQQLAKEQGIKLPPRKRDFKNIFKVSSRIHDETVLEVKHEND